MSNISLILFLRVASVIPALPPALATSSCVLGSLQLLLIYCSNIRYKTLII